MSSFKIIPVQVSPGEEAKLEKKYWFYCCAVFISNVCGTIVGIIAPAFLTEHYSYSTE